MRPRRLLAGVFGLTVLAVGSFAGYAWSGLPSRAAVRALERRNPELTSVMRQRAEEAQRRGRKPRRSQSWVPLSRISRSLVQAVVVAEDAKFVDHDGFDWDAIKESARSDWRAGRFVRGGSTITQQLAKNLFFTTRRSLLRKLQETVVAYWLERDVSKGRILELYLNVIEWGDGIYGCEAAARHYYGKPAADLDEREAAGLAAMIPAPRRLNPDVDPARHARAQRRVLALMARAGYVKESTGRWGTAPPAVEPAEPAPDEDEAVPEPPAPEPEPTAWPSPPRSTMGAHDLALS